MLPIGSVKIAISRESIVGGRRKHPPKDGGGTPPSLGVSFDRSRKLSRVEPERSGVALVVDATASLDQVEPVRPSGPNTSTTCYQPRARRTATALWRLGSLPPGPVRCLQRSRNPLGHESTSSRKERGSRQGVGIRPSHARTALASGASSSRHNRESRATNSKALR